MEKWIYIKGLELRVWLAQLGLACVLIRFSGDFVGETGGVTCSVCFVSFQCQWHSVVLWGSWGQWGCAVIRAVGGLFLTVRLMETDPSCIVPLDSAADLVCIDSGSANAQMRGPSDGNAHSGTEQPTHH